MIPLSMRLAAALALLIGLAVPVQPTGSITFPLLNEVPVAGLTVSEIQRRLTALLIKDFLVDPHVEVKVKEFQSQFVIVTRPVPASMRRNFTSLLPKRVSPPAVEIAPVTVRSPSMAYRPGRWTSPSTVTY